MERDLYVHEFKPRPAVVTRRTEIKRPRFEVIDAHNHLGQLLPGLSFSGSWSKRPVTELLDVLDEAGVRGIVDLDGQWGDALKKEIARYQEPHPGRFAVFTGIEYDAMKRDDFPKVLLDRFKEAVAAGARGLKVWKPLGLTARDSKEELIAPNDPRLHDLFAAAGELGLPVLIHVADPVAFFDPLDCNNERWEELHGHRDWHFHGPQFPPFMKIMEQFEDLVRAHPKTSFIGAHVGCYPENLQWVDRMLSSYPNFHVDISARLGELGRVPYSARDLFLKHADRILFGTDIPPSAEVYRLHYRFLETRDEYFPYYLGEMAPQGRWMIYGVDLPDEVLKKVYHENARRLIRFG